MTLEEYREKRNFKKTGEPKDKKRSGNKRPIFVVQKHDASQLHYDLRLEIDGVLKSWAVPKGPSINPNDKRLATETEDHPLKYANFEGKIPKEEYGGGTVMVWDKGTYKNLSVHGDKEISMQEAYKNGHISFELHGKKLRGHWTLAHMKNRGDDWLLIKKEDKHSDGRVNILKEDKSVKSGKSIEEIG